MKVVARDFVGGYYLTDPADPGLLRGVRYVHSYPCGTVGNKSFTYIKFTPGELPDTLGNNQEMFDMSNLGADEAISLLNPSALGSSAPSAIERITQAIAEGVSMEDAAMAHIARLLPEYCGATFSEAIEYKHSLLIETTDPETGAISYNIQRCSEE